MGPASKILLFPYWATLSIRNYLYDHKIIKSERNDIPVISIGNITVGGTGKTPHVEMLAGALKDKYRIAVISRGYGRSYKGFREVRISDNYKVCGDEPLQIKRKFPDIIVAVCKNRNYAIRRVIEKYGVNLVLLDDGFQYRKITPSKNILLVLYDKPITKDELLPIGTLRDLPSQIKRADIVIVSKSPDFGDYDGGDDQIRAAEGVAAEEEKWRKTLHLAESQRLYFSTSISDLAKPVFPEFANNRYLYSQFAIGFTGIARNSQFTMQLRTSHKLVGLLTFSDHNNYSKGDIRKIRTLSRKRPEAAIITTEKDSQRLLYNKHITSDMKERLFYIPVECKIMPEEKMTEFFEIAPLLKKSYGKTKK